MKDVDVLARTIFGEARGETVSGMEAVASVVMNRLAFSRRRGRYWWGNSVVDICQSPRQFSCRIATTPIIKSFVRLRKTTSFLPFANG